MLTRARSFLVARMLACAVMGLIVTAQVAAFLPDPPDEPQPAPYVVTEDDDLDGDDEADNVTADPAGGGASQPGQASTLPWYDSEAAFGTLGFFAVGNASPPGSLTFHTSDSPDPRPTDLATLTINGNPDDVDYFGMEITFNLFLAVRTTLQMGNAHQRYIQRARANWAADGNGLIDANGQWLGGGQHNCSGSSVFTLVTNGDVVPVSTGIPINTQSLNGTYTTVP